MNAKDFPNGMAYVLPAAVYAWVTKHGGTYKEAETYLLKVAAEAAVAHLKDPAQPTSCQVITKLFDGLQIVGANGTPFTFREFERHESPAPVAKAEKPAPVVKPAPAPAKPAVEPLKGVTDEDVLALIAKKGTSNVFVDQVFSLVVMHQDEAENARMIKLDVEELHRLKAQREPVAEEVALNSESVDMFIASNPVWSIVEKQPGGKELMLSVKADLEEANKPGLREKLEGLQLRIDQLQAIIEQRYAKAAELKNSLSLLASHLSTISTPVAIPATKPVKAERVKTAPKKDKAKQPVEVVSKLVGQYDDDEPAGTVKIPRRRQDAVASVESE